MAHMKVTVRAGFANLIVGRELLLRVTEVSLQTASQLSNLSFHGEEQIL